MNKNNLLSEISTYCIIIIMFLILFIVTLILFYPNQLAIKLLVIMWLFSCLILGTSQLLIE